jgi:hypothetical protein
MKKEKKYYESIIKYGLVLFGVGALTGLIMASVFTFKWLFS